jgi:uncharacterized SAM-binding protein YcdF (DUF218 family)
MAASASITDMPPKNGGTARLRRAAMAMAGLLVLAVGLWSAGFVWFVWQARRPAILPAHVDGIVALTGGADRVETALRMLAEGRGDRLLVSGVARGNEFTELAARAGVDPHLAPRVTLGHSATSTVGNAAETAAWVEAHGIGSLIVVTAGYHIPRAVAEISHVIPGVVLYPVAVQSPALRGGFSFTAVRLLISEYNKLLGARLGVGRLMRG